MYRRTLPIVFLTACGAETDLETAFCDLLTNGPTTALAASETAESAPAASFEGQAIVVDLTTGATIAFEPDEAGSYVFGLSHDVPLDIVDASRDGAARLDEVVGGACGGLAVRSTWDLELQTYYLTFDTNLDSVTVVAEESDDDL